MGNHPHTVEDNIKHLEPSSKERLSSYVNQTATEKDRMGIGPYYGKSQKPGLFAG